MENTTAFNEERRKEAEEHPENKKRLQPDICWVCKRIEEEEWNGVSNLSHCRNCHAVWKGIATAHCNKCHRTFSSNSTLDLAHGTRRDSSGELKRVCHEPVNLVETKNEFNVPVYKGSPMEEGVKALFSK